MQVARTKQLGCHWKRAMYYVNAYRNTLKLKKNKRLNYTIYQNN